MKVVVTGGDGFIGDHVVKELRNRGFEPVIFDRRRGGDVRDRHSVEQAMKGADGVIHLAGILGTEELFHEAVHAVKVNVEGGTNVILACLDEEAVFVNITMPHVWNNIYQATKQAVEHIATAYHEHFGLRVCNVRAFNAFGPGQKFGTPQKIIPTFSVNAWRDLPIPIWGDGEQLVDLVYVEDIARVLVDALGFHDNRTIDAGTGSGISVLEVARIVSEVTTSNSELDHMPMRMGETPADVVSKGEGWDALGWHPEFRMEDLVRTIDSYRRV